MSTGTFPYDGKQSQSGSTDQYVGPLQTVVNQIQDTVLGLVQPDPDIKIISHFDGSLTSHRGLAAVSAGAIRYWAGKFDEGVLVEQGNTNLLLNPSAEVDATNWSAVDGSVTLTRDNTVAYTANNTTSAASFKVAGTGNAGLGYVKAASVTVTPNAYYSVSAYVYSATTVEARLELYFSGGLATTVTGSLVTISAGQWTRLRFEDQNSAGNTSCEVRVYLVQGAPTFPNPSQLSTIGATATAAVTDGSMTINTGDICMCATTANPAGPLDYAWHMATFGATGVNNVQLNLDDSFYAPTFVAGTQFSKLAPATGDAVGIPNSSLTLNAGDFVFCSLRGQGYGWHVVTTGGVPNSSALRLDDSPSPPDFGVSTRLTRIVPTATALVTDNSTSLVAGDMVFCRLAGSSYNWHMVITGATGVDNAALRLDNAASAPAFASGSRLSKKTPTATGSNTDNSAVLNTGDFALAIPSSNPADSSYGWHMVTTGATGVSSSSLRLDQASSQSMNFDCVQLEAGTFATSFTDSYQGTGFSGSLGLATSRAGTTLSYPTSGNLSVSAGSVAFWLYPLWAGNDGLEHILFDIAVGAEQDRMRFSKDNANNFNFSIYDTNGQLKQWTVSATSIARETWTHLAVTWSSGTVTIYLNGTSQSLTVTGSGAGQVTNLAASMFIGTDYLGNTLAGSVFDDLVVANAALAAYPISTMANDIGAFLGLASARKGIDTAQGSASTGTAGAQLIVAHGLGVTPSFVQLTPRSNGVVYLSAASDATNIYVTASANNTNFDWRAWA